MDTYYELGRRVSKTRPFPGFATTTTTTKFKGLDDYTEVPIRVDTWIGMYTSQTFTVQGLDNSSSLVSFVVTEAVKGGRIL